MSKFIKLKNLIINVNYIHSIVIEPNKYCINVMSNKFDGRSWFLSGFAGMGSIYSDNYEIEVCETNDFSDYKIITDWIDAQ